MIYDSSISALALYDLFLYTGIVTCVYSPTLKVSYLSFDALNLCLVLLPALFATKTGLFGQKLTLNTDYNHCFASGMHSTPFLHSLGPSPSCDASHARHESRQLYFEIFDLQAASQKKVGGNW
jgi:hypothetical protein